MSDFDTEVDARNLNCPLPVLRAKKAIAGMSSGQVLKFVATDPGSVKVFVVFCRQTGNDLISSIEESGEYHYLIKKA
jgi:tRNA 2-thiouridine synthesizing protein A